MRDPSGRGAASSYDIADELGGDGARLIEALRTREDSRLQGFRTRAAEELEAFLTKEGYLDARRVLDESDIRSQLLASPAAARLPAEVVSAFSHRWWSFCLESGQGCISPDS